MDFICLHKEDGTYVKKKGGEMVERSEFKGKPVLILKRDENDKYPFSFGLGKARLILENLEEIKKFLAEYSEEEEKA